MGLARSLVRVCDPLPLLWGSAVSGVKFSAASRVAIITFLWSVVAHVLFVTRYYVILIHAEGITSNDA